MSPNPPRYDLPPLAPERHEEFHELDAEHIQRLCCTHRVACLDIAIAQGWPTFACCSCRAYQPMDADQWRDDVKGLIACLAVMVASIKSTGDQPPVRRLLRRLRSR
jgi:hypothetical protein